MAGQKKLSPKQHKFVDEYIMLDNATQAAKNAGYSEKTAYSQGQRMLKNVEVAAEVARRRAELRKTCATPERIVKEYLSLYNTNMRDIAAWGPGGVAARPSDTLTEEQAAAISEISETKDGNIKVKLHDKKGILDSLARIAGMFQDKLDVSGKLEYELVLPEELSGE